MKTKHIVIGVGAILAIGAAWLLVSTKSSNPAGGSNQSQPGSIEQPEMIGGKTVVKAPAEDTELLKRIKERLKAQYEASGQTVSVLKLSTEAMKEFSRIKSGK